MKLGVFGRVTLAALAALALGLSMTACGGGTIAFLWTFGAQYNQIVGYKVDQYSGNLTEVVGSPFSIVGTNPANMVVKVGGRYVYILTKGNGANCATPAACSGDVANEGIDLYSVGNDGVLTFQHQYALQAQSLAPVWLQMDGTGTYLYVLSKFAKYAQCPTYQLATACPSGTNFPGAIEVYATDSDTGRLTLITNQSVKDPTDLTGQTNLLYFPVGSKPVMSKVAGSCLYTVDAADNTVFPYVVSGSQLNLASTGAITTGATQLTSINGNGNTVILTDGNNGSQTNYILPYTVGTSCALQSLVGGRIPNAANVANPTNSLIDSAGKFLYVLNSGIGAGTTTQPNSQISGFALTANTTPQPLQSFPYPVGSGPNCIVEDPTNEYLYISNFNDGTITGVRFNATTGTLQPLTNGSTFQATKQLSCLAISNNVD